jgi:serine/threonine protein phosphatase PrpC
MGAGAPADVVPQLIAAALAGGARDNITAVVARYNGA